MVRLDAAEARARLGRAEVLDCRSAAAFATGHLTGSGHLPFEELADRRYELPARETAIVVVSASGREAERAAAALEALGYTDVCWLDAELEGLLDSPPDTGPPLPLWRPSPFLAARIGSIPCGHALDVAAGAGREAVFMALRGFEVEARDRAPEALRWARALAARHGVSITTIEQDLEARDASLPASRFALVTVFRFLHRPLFRSIEAALAPGGHLIYETFLRGQERFGRPSHPRFLLHPRELRSAFPKLEVLEYEESDPARAPVMARLHARRPAPGPPPG
jgi:tellurite methyltransferase